MFHVFAWVMIFLLAFNVAFIEKADAERSDYLQFAIGASVLVGPLSGVFRTRKAPNAGCLWATARGRMQAQLSRLYHKRATAKWKRRRDVDIPD